jgi:hypothetical protein
MIVTTRLNCNLKDETIEEIQGRMKRVHMQLVDIVEEECDELGFEPSSLAALYEHKEQAIMTSAIDFNDGTLFLRLNGEALQCKLHAARAVLKAKDTSLTSGSSSHGRALAILLNPGDQFAFNTAIQMLLKDPGLLKSYSELLEQQCQRIVNAATDTHFAFQRLELKDWHLSCALPNCIASLLGVVDFYDLSGNDFEGIKDVRSYGPLGDLLYRTNNLRKTTELDFSKYSDEVLHQGTPQLLTWI